ncbi:MAG: helix-turn-helix domain-containing protein [Deltaproteobacteria bacterium]|nr:helix-turn-helix domain-containing protein [Deltaproteobacteria bacterium]
MMDLLQNKRFFRPDEVAVILDLSRRTIYRMIRDERLHGVKWGSGPWRIPRESLAGLFPEETGSWQVTP